MATPPAIVMAPPLIELIASLELRIPSPPLRIKHPVEELVASLEFRIYNVFLVDIVLL